jgi:hypothetical protein
MFTAFGGILVASDLGVKKARAGVHRKHGVSGGTHMATNAASDHALVIFLILIAAIVLVGALYYFERRIIAAAKCRLGKADAAAVELRQIGVITEVLRERLEKGPMEVELGEGVTAWLVRSPPAPAQPHAGSATK